MTSEDKSRFSRRDLILRVAKAGALACGTAGGAYILRDNLGPSAPRETGADVVIPSYAVKDTAGKMAIAHGPDRAKTLPAALEAIGGIGQFIQRGDRVLLKLNVAFASPPLLSATSNPELVSILTALCLKAGAAEVRVTDNPINDPESCFRLSGIAEATEKAGAKLYVPRPAYFVPYTLANARLIRNWPVLYRPLEGVTKVIGVAPVKDHHRSGASMTMKNWYGLLGGRRNVFHQDIYTIIEEVARMMRPTFVVLDGTVTMMKNGPTGGATSDLKPTNTMIVSTDQVAADAYGSTLLGLTPSDLPFIAKAAAAGCGTADYKSLNPKEVNVA